MAQLKTHISISGIEHHRDSEFVPVPENYVTESKHHITSDDHYKTLYALSIENPSQFWSDAAQEFTWNTPFSLEKVCSSNFDISKGPIRTSWFEDGWTNIAYNALDRHIIAGKGDQVAFYYEGNDVDDDHRVVTYSTLYQQVCKLANVLKSYNVNQGDVVSMYMPMVPELPMAMLACARLGIVHSVVFGGFSAEALAGRIRDSRCKLIITCDGVMRGGKIVKLKEVSDQAIEICTKHGHDVLNQLVLERLGSSKVDTKMHPQRDHWWHEKVATASDECDPVWLQSEAPLFALYTSGSTGAPKGLLHTTGGYMVYSAITFKYSFNYHAGDIFFCTADCGWITGHSYLTYGPLLNGATQVLFEGVPNWPDAGRFWQIVDKYKVTQFYTAPTAIRSLERCGDSFVTKYSRKSLKILGTVGEPINHETWLWYFNVVGNKCAPVVDTWWQTETGGHMIVPLPYPGQKMKPGSASFPFFGCAPCILDEYGNELTGEAEGFLMIKRGWPGMARTILGDHTRFEQVYFNLFKGYYMTGDGCRRDADGYYWLTGRVDDVLNVSGHRIGTAEVETALVAHPSVVEAAVVGSKHDIKGQGIYAFVTLKEGCEPSLALKAELIKTVRQEIGPIASPDVIHWATALPKTRSGKIMRRILRKIAEVGKGVSLDELGDISTLSEPTVVEQLMAGIGI